MFHHLHNYIFCRCVHQVTLNPEELDMDTVAMQAKYEQTVRQQQADIQKEDFSDMVAEHSAKAAKVSYRYCMNEAVFTFAAFFLFYGWY